VSADPIRIESARFSRNRLLASLESSQLEALAAAATIEPLTPGEILHQAGERIERVYFPLTGTVSLVGTSVEGTMVEAATIGNEGTTGVPVFLDTDTGPLPVIAQVPGEALAVRADVFGAQMTQGTSLDTAMRRYIQAQIVQTAQTAVCNRLHELEERAARWLLQTHDRVDGDDIGLTHEFMSIMLGVHRPTVTLALGSLQRAGLIRHGRGRIQVVDRPGLESASCECYAIIEGEYARLLG
jgi:CRP-like cAMP-binding protein